MKEIKVKKTETETWRVSEWGERFSDMVAVRAPHGGWFPVSHEDLIPDHWPDKVQEAVRAEVMANRPLAKNEVRTRPSGFLYQLRWHNGARQARWVNGDRVWTNGTGFGCSDAQARAEAWFEANDPHKQWQPVEGAPGWEVRKLGEDVQLRAPGRREYGQWWSFEKEWRNDQPLTLYGAFYEVVCPEPVIATCCKLLGVEREVELAANQVHQDGAVYSLRWHDGKPECLHIRYTDGRKEPTGGAVWGDLDPIGPDALAWFRKHCPIDRFITNDGKLLQFRMRDDGEAEAVASGGVLAHTDSENRAVHFPDFGGELCLKLRDFRDEERVKWRFEYRDFRSDHPWVCVYCDGIPDGRGFYDKRGASSALRNQPTWVRNKAEAIWNENQPQWRTEWIPGNASCSGRVAVSKRLSGRAWVNWGNLTRDGWGLSDIMTKTVTAEARAKFRANYELQRDEVWSFDQVTKLRFEQDGDGYRVRVGSEYFWGENSVRHSIADNKSWGYLITKNEAERLEMFGRCRRFFYEEHPGRGLTPGNVPVHFEIKEGRYGQAVLDADTEFLRAGCSAIDTGADIRDDKRWEPLLTKLRAWTEKQLAKKQKAVVFEGAGGYFEGPPISPTLGTVSFRTRDRPLIPDGPVRVTIEPIESEGA